MNPARRFAVAELKGGLGNQLFEYAAARALSLREGRALYFAWTSHRGDTQRRFMLDAFRLAPDARPELLGLTMLRLLGLRSPLFNRKAGRLWRLAACRLASLQERSFAYAPLASDAFGVVLDGYFQSYRYFADQERALRAELQLASQAMGHNAELLRRMADENAVCLHVRRGDYAADPATSAFHGLLGLAYYRAAIEALGPAASNATFYVFSDEPAWARRHLQTGRPTVIVEHNGVDAPHEDLRLMMACRHFVIANSSLSWWGAWLAPSADKQVVAPRRWFADPTVDTADLCPPAWQRL